jgi:ribosomal protein S18 acetylase RimI-like enzyme
MKTHVMGSPTAAVLHAPFTDEALLQYVADNSQTQYQDYLRQKSIDPGPLFRARVAGADTCIVSRNGDKGYDGVVAMKDLEWDAEVFGHKVGRLEHIAAEDRDTRNTLLDGALEWCRDRGIRMVSARIHGAAYPTLHSLQEMGFYLVDSMNIFLGHREEMQASEAKEETRIQFYPLQQADTVQKDLLAELAGHAFQETRIVNDPLVPFDVRDRFYRSLTDTLLSGNGVGVYAMLEDDVAGFAVGDRDEADSVTLGVGLGYLWMIAVDERFAGHGLGRRLFQRFRHEYHQTAEWLEVGTQIHNTAALNIYRSSGLRQVSSLHTLHKWIEA